MKPVTLPPGRVGSDEAISDGIGNQREHDRDTAGLLAEGPQDGRASYVKMTSGPISTSSAE